MCFDSSTDLLISFFFYFSSLSISWDKTVLDLSQLITLEWSLSVQVKGRVDHLSLFKANATMTKLGEEAFQKPRQAENWVSWTNQLSCKWKFIKEN